MNSGLEIETTDSEGQWVIRLKGDLDMESSPRLIETVRKSIKGAAGVTIDLKEVGYVDSSGIAVLVQGYKLANKQKVEFTLLDPSAQARAVIELSQLHKFFKIVESEAGG